MEKDNFNLKEELKIIGMTEKDCAHFIDFYTNTVSRWGKRRRRNS